MIEDFAAYLTCLIILAVAGVVVLFYQEFVLALRWKLAKAQNRPNPYAEQERKEALRRERNPRPYLLTEIPPHLTQLTLLMTTDWFRDEGLAVVYLLAGREIPEGAADNPYKGSRFWRWDDHERAIWAWREMAFAHQAHMGELTRAKFMTMLTLLEENGWQLQQKHWDHELNKIYYLAKS